MKKTEPKEEVVVETPVDEVVEEKVEETVTPEVVETKEEVKKEKQLPECPTCLGKGRVDIPGNPSTMSCEDCEGTGVKK